MYELLIKLYNELDYKKYTIKDLEEFRRIIEQIGDKREEVKLKKVKEKASK